MGNSAISSIYSAIASYSIAPTTDTAAVHVQAIGSVTETVQTDDLPMRKLQAFANESQGSMAHVALGNTVQVEWTIVDRFFYRIANQGRGWEDFADDLSKYAENYINYIRTRRAPTSQSHILSASFVPQIFNIGNQRIAGVDVILQIAEVIA